MMRIRDIFKLTLDDLTKNFLTRRCTPTGVELMHLATNISQTATTSSSEKTEKLHSCHLQHIYDGLEYTQLNLRYHLSGPDEDRWGYPQWLGRAGCRLESDPLKADFVIFTGGADVSPKLYADPSISETRADPDRDKADIQLYNLCVANGIPMLGVCRGAQFLWVMQGGKLFQHVDNHNNGEHEIFVFDGENKKYRASSVHHQMCKPETLDGFKLLANACVSKNRKAGNWSHSGPSSDFEIYAFPEKGILGIQGHPEYPGFPSYSELCIRLLDKYIYDNPATIYKNGALRVASVVNGPKISAEIKVGE